MPASDEVAPPARRAILRDLSPATRGALLMICAAVVFSAMNTIIRVLAAELPAFEIAFFRNFCALIFMLPWVARYGMSSLRTERIKLYSMRALAGLASMLCWFTAVTLIPLAEATALSFTGPMFATAGAALLLRETVGWRRWGAVVMGFVGVLIIVRPGAVDLSFGASLALASAVFMAAGSLLVKTLSRTEPTGAIVSYMVIYLAPLSLIPALFVWVWPPMSTWPYLAALGLLGAIAHLCYTGALAAADASAVMPLDYMRLPAVALFAYAMFAEVPTVWTWAGAGVIILASTYIAQREMRLRRQRAPAVAAP
ncbi:MAG: DMT family transporter [Alphaproteobacteria bacterium]|nr:DMT family transporter [Alphaproteobacteria bacterium]